MLVISVLVYTALANAEVAERPGYFDHRCPIVNGLLPTLMTHEDDCHLFYMCNNGVRCEKR